MVVPSFSLIGSVAIVRLAFAKLVLIRAVVVVERRETRDDPA